jgi:DNA-binding NtrC family response regulator
MTAKFREGAVLGIAREALQYLTALPWSGNVRELRGVIEAACAQARHTITVGDIREVVRRHEGFAAVGLTATATETTTPGVAPNAFDRTTAEEAAFGGLDYDRLTAAYFFHLMRRTGGQLSEVARLAGIGKTTAYEWRKRYAGGHATDPPPPADDR